MKTYRIASLADFYSVPANRRAAMFADLESAMALNEFAQGDEASANCGVLEWRDDGSPDCSLVDAESGEVHLKLKVKR